jgi:hypothetical protein
VPAIRADPIKNQGGNHRSGYGQGPKPGSKRKSGGRNHTAKAKDSASSDSGKPSHSQRKAPAKGKSALDQVNHPMVQVVENAVAAIALVAIDLVQIDAVIDKYFSAHYIQIRL